MANIALFLVGKKGYRVLQALSQQHTSGVVTDVVASRDTGIDNDFYSEISDLCNRNGIQFHDRLSQSFSKNDYNGYLLAIGWKWMLPTKSNVLVIHDSILPKYRGFAPLVNCLISGDRTIGATALFAANEYDRERILIQSSREIDYPIKISNAIDLMCEIYIDIATKLVNLIDDDQELTGIEQDEKNATYSLWRDEDDYWIDWSWQSDKIVRFIDAVGPPYAGAHTFCNNSVAIIHSAQLVPDVKINDRSSAIGKVIYLEDMYPVVVCGQGLIKITDIKSNDGKSLFPLNKFRTRFHKKR